MTSVCVYCGARSGLRPAYTVAATATGRMLAANGWRLVYGAGDVGLMGQVARAAQVAEAVTMGVIPAHLMKMEVGKRDLNQFVITENMHERKKVMFMNSDAVAVLPGGAGILLGGKVRAPATRFACAGCHGEAAEGKREGATVFPALSLQRLADPARPGGAYVEALFRRAVAEGTGADGQPLDDEMPRFVMDDATLAALVTYLKRIDGGESVGITAQTVTLRAGADPAEQAGFAAAAGWFNAEGGAFGRILRVVREGEATFGGEDLSKALSGRMPDLATLAPPTAGGNGATTAARMGATMSELPAAARPAFLKAALLGEAMVACGRAVTRSCLLDALGRIDLAEGASPALP